MSLRRFLIEAEGVADAQGVSHSPGALLLEIGPPPDGGGAAPVFLLRCGPAREIRALSEAAAATRIDAGRAVLAPALVNAHTHLDLTHVGPLRFDASGGFPGWAEQVRAARPQSAAGIAASVKTGVRLSVSGGVAAVGDIAGAMRVEAVDALRESALLGVSFLEFFGIGERQEGVLARLEELLGARPDLLEAAPMRLGLQPHAPYSVGPALFLASARLGRTLGLRLSTHLCESEAERRLLARGDGAMRDMLSRLGAWDERAEQEFGGGGEAGERLARAFAEAPFVVAHVNDCTDRTLRVLKETGACVAYCPRSSAYFGHEKQFGAHRYREMIRAGVVVALGTDSVINLPDTPDRLSTLDEMRFLYRRDGTSPELLLRMATCNGAVALGLDPRWFTFDGGGAGPARLAGVIAVEVEPSSAGQSPLERAMMSDGAAPLLLGADRGYPQ